MGGDNKRKLTNNGKVQRRGKFLAQLSILVALGSPKTRDSSQTLEKGEKYTYLDTSLIGVPNGPIMRHRAWHSLDLSIQALNPL